jgi:hypothetical protein
MFRDVCLHFSMVLAFLFVSCATTSKPPKVGAFWGEPLNAAKTNATCCINMGSPQSRSSFSILSPAKGFSIETTNN